MKERKARERRREKERKIDFLLPNRLLLRAETEVPADSTSTLKSQFTT